VSELRGSTLIILLAGGNKATQSQDIQTALELARQIADERP
jgi:putative component of toxin-antitoxin plasmid stabilization module